MTKARRDGGSEWGAGKERGTKLPPRPSDPSICDREAAKMRVKYWRNVTGVFQTPPPPSRSSLHHKNILRTGATKTPSLPSWEKVERGGPDCLLFRRGGCRERISADIIAAGSDPLLPSPPQKIINSACPAFSRNNECLRSRHSSLEPLLEEYVHSAGSGRNLAEHSI